MNKGVFKDYCDEWSYELDETNVEAPCIRTKAELWGERHRIVTRDGAGRIWRDEVPVTKDLGNVQGGIGERNEAQEHKKLGNMSLYLQEHVITVPTWPIGHSSAQ